MVKQAEKNEKRNVFTPIAGLILGLGLLVVAYILAGELFGYPNQLLPFLKVRALNGLGTGMGIIFLGTAKIPVAQVVFTFGIFLGFLAFAYFLVTMLAGRDPEDAKNLPELALRTKKSKKK